MTARVRSEKSLLERPLKPIAGLDADSLLEMTEASYIDLVQWTGEQARADKRGKLRREEQSNPPAAVWNLSDALNQWVRQVQGTESHYYRVIGSTEALMVTRLVRERPVARRVRVVQAGRSLTEITTGVAKATSRIIDRRERAECAAIASRSREDFLMRRVERLN